MNELSTVLAAVVPVFALMAAGFVFRRLKWLNASADESLLRICVNVLLPCLIFESTFANPALQRKANLLWPPLLGSSLVLLGIAFAWVVGKWVGLTAAPERRTFALTVGLQNYGYIPIPLCLLLFDQGTVGVLFVHNVGVELVLWTVGLAVLSGQGLQGWRKLLNAPTLALLVALGLNALGLPRISDLSFGLGRSLMTAVHWLGQSGIPLALLLIGAIIADHWHEVRGGRMARVVVTAIVVRLLILGPVFFLLARWLPCSLELKRVLVVQGAMSSAVLPVALAKHFGGDPRIALQVVLGTALAGLITIPIWIRLGGAISGLW